MNGDENFLTDVFQIGVCNAEVSKCSPDITRVLIEDLAHIGSSTLSGHSSCAVGSVDCVRLFCKWS